MTRFRQLAFILTSALCVSAIADEPVVPATEAQWRQKRDGWVDSLRRESFASWPDAPCPQAVAKKLGWEQGLQIRKVPKF